MEKGPKIAWFRFLTSCLKNSPFSGNHIGIRNCCSPPTNLGVGVEHRAQALWIGRSSAKRCCWFGKRPFGKVDSQNRLTFIRFAIVTERIFWKKAPAYAVFKTISGIVAVAQLQPMCIRQQNERGNLPMRLNVLLKTCRADAGNRRDFPRSP